MKELLSKEDIVSACKKWTFKGHIYFLIFENEIVYVGKSKRLAHRMEEHVPARHGWAKVFALECEHNEMNDLEKAYIEKFKPRWNVQHNRKKNAGTNFSAVIRGG